jgi:methyl-accepting chemotaxis protein
MKLMRDLSVAARLKMLGIVIGGALLGIAVLYAINIYLEDGAEESLAKLTEFQLQVARLESGMLQARRNEKDFIMRHSNAYLDSHATTMKRLYETLDRTTTLSPADELTQLLVSIRKNLQLYQETFQGMGQLRVEIGLDENSGLTGVLRSAVHSVEDVVEKLGNTELLASMLMLRRHEKDFFMRGNEEYLTAHRTTYAKFLKQLNSAALASEDKRTLRDFIDNYRSTFTAASTATQKEVVALEKLREAVHRVEPILVELHTRSNTIIATQIQDHTFDEMILKLVFFAVLAVIATVTTLTGRETFSAILNPLRTLHDTVTEVMTGNYDTRASLVTKDELGDLGRAFDNMLDDRLKALDDAVRENDRLNNSIIDLLEAVAKLSDRDLTVKVPIKEDVTGPVADAMNMMAKETAKVLGQINRIAADVEAVAMAVREQGSKVSEVAGEERRVITDTLDQLKEAAVAMNNIATLAAQCNDIAARASSNTSEALQTVNQTVAGMSEIREIISETEKRIKRLGERSQEITGIVEIINNIAERTHVLALNASMQAAVAGEAGRGFAVVADEVQRLAESSRTSTSQIASLVGNIRTETAETMATMNRAIEQVIAGSNLAEQTGRKMQDTMASTSELVAGVNEIAERSGAQATMTNALLGQALNIQKSTEVTSEELSEQGAHTENLVMFSKSLVESVRVFKLPEAV